MPDSFHPLFYATTLIAGLIAGIYFGHLETLPSQFSSAFLSLTANVVKLPPTVSHTTPPMWQLPLRFRDYEPLGVENTDEQWWENFESNRTLYLAVVAGMGNTFQSMASALRVAFEEKINVKFVFYRHEFGYAFGPARWEELFSFPKINADHTFPDGEVNKDRTKACGAFFPQTKEWNEKLKHRLQWMPEPDGSGEYCCFKASQWKQKPFPESALWFYRILRPAEEILQYIKQFKIRTEWDRYQWIGVHLRRSDNGKWMTGGLRLETQEELKGKVNTTSMDTMIPVENYIETMKKIESDWPIHSLGPYQRVRPPRFFLATDNAVARQKIFNAFDDGKVVSFDHPVEGRQLRKGVWGMKLAVIDLYLLAACRVFIGTPFSTFSEAAHLIGNNLYFEVDFEYTTSL